MRAKFLVLFLPVFLTAQETVYCLHGFMRKKASMEKMAKRFSKEGYAVENWGYPSRKKTVQEHAEDLVCDLQKVAQKNPGQPIHFVTHSLGGIILRCAHNHPDFPKEAKEGRAALLAPPNKGSAFGRFLGHIGPVRKLLGRRAGKQILFSPNFDYVGSFPEDKAILVISGTFGWNPIVKGKNDGKVGFTESCLDTPHSHVSHFAGHCWIMMTPKVIEEAFRFIHLEN